MNRPKLNVGTNNMHNYSVQHYLHRYFNETPSINRNVAEINRRNNEVALLLDNKEINAKESKKKETFRGPYKDDGHAEFFFNRKCGGSKPKAKQPERFTVKKRVSFKDVVNKALNAILAIIFILFMLNLAYICFCSDVTAEEYNREHSLDDFF